MSTQHMAFWLAALLGSDKGAKRATVWAASGIPGYTRHSYFSWFSVCSCRSAALLSGDMQLEVLDKRHTSYNLLTYPVVWQRDHA